jgi:hypothetical protein
MSVNGWMHRICGRTEQVWPQGVAVLQHVVWIEAFASAAQPVALRAAARTTIAARLRRAEIVRANRSCAH